MIVDGKKLTPKLSSGVWCAPSADVVGDVSIGKDSSVWFNTTLRGDVMPIVIGERTNIQDGSTLHGTYKKCGAVIGDDVTVGHNCILHGCEIGNEVLVGMGSIIMDQAKIPNRSIIGAGSLVTEGQEFPEGHLILGRPAKALRKLTDKELSFLKQSAQNYIEYKSWYTTNEGSENE